MRTVLTWRVFFLFLAGSLAFALQAIPNLAGHWKLDEASSPAADSANGNPGTWTGGPAASNQTPNPGAANPNCISLDGVDDYVDIGNPAVLASIASQITVSAWVNLDPVTAERKVVAKWSDSPWGYCWLMTVYASSVNFWVQPASGTQTGAASGAPLGAGAWHHLAGTYDGANVRLYIDGAQAGSAALAGALRTDSTTPIRIGAGSDGTVGQAEPFDGRIDDVRIYDRALTPAEITTLYTGMLPSTFTLAAAGQTAQISLSWSAPAGATGYEVRRGSSASGPFAPIASLPATQTGYADGAVTPGQPYSYLIAASTPTGPVLSNVATATALAPPARSTDHEEGLIDDKCACGTSLPAAPPVGAWVALAAALALLLRR
jgi:hypothetical protein